MGQQQEPQQQVMDIWAHGGSEAPAFSRRRNEDEVKDERNKEKTNQSIESDGKKEHEEEVAQEFECVICMKILLAPVTTPCGHNFCKGCIDEAVGYRPCCPLCRFPLLLCGAADPSHGVAASAALRVNGLLQQLLEQRYPRAMEQRKRYEEEKRREAEEKAAAAAVASVAVSSGRLQRPLRQRQGRRDAPTNATITQQYGDEEEGLGGEALWLEEMVAAEHLQEEDHEADEDEEEEQQQQHDRRHHRSSSRSSGSSSSNISSSSSSSSNISSSSSSSSANTRGAGGGGTRRRGEQILSLLRLFGGPPRAGRSNSSNNSNGSSNNFAAATAAGAHHPTVRASERSTDPSAATEGGGGGSPPRLISPLFPGETLSLHVYEEEYVQLVQLALQNARTFGVAFPSPPRRTGGARGSSSYSCSLYSLSRAFSRGAATTRQRVYALVCLLLLRMRLVLCTLVQLQQLCPSRLSRYYRSSRAMTSNNTSSSTYSSSTTSSSSSLSESSSCCPSSNSSSTGVSIEHHSQEHPGGGGDEEGGGREEEEQQPPGLMLSRVASPQSVFGNSSPTVVTAAGEEEATAAQAVAPSSSSVFSSPSSACAPPFYPASASSSSSSSVQLSEAVISPPSSPSSPAPPATVATAATVTAGTTRARGIEGGEESYREVFEEENTTGEGRNDRIDTRAVTSSRERGRRRGGNDVVTASPAISNMRDPASGGNREDPTAADRSGQPEDDESVEYGCCVEIQQHTALPPAAGTAIGRCLIRCTCKNRFVVRRRVFLEAPGSSLNAVLPHTSRQAAVSGVAATRRTGPPSARSSREPTRTTAAETRRIPHDTQPPEAAGGATAALAGAGTATEAGEHFERREAIEGGSNVLMQRQQREVLAAGTLLTNETMEHAPDSNGTSLRVPGVVEGGAPRGGEGEVVVGPSVERLGGGGRGGGETTAQMAGEEGGAATERDMGTGDTENGDNNGGGGGLTYEVGYCEPIFDDSLLFEDEEKEEQQLQEQIERTLTMSSSRLRERFLILRRTGRALRTVAAASDAADVVLPPTETATVPSLHREPRMQQEMIQQNIIREEEEEDPLLQEGLRSRRGVGGHSINETHHGGGVPPLHREATNQQHYHHAIPTAADTAEGTHDRSATVAAAAAAGGAGAAATATTATANGAARSTTAGRLVPPFVGGVQGNAVCFPTGLTTATTTNTQQKERCEREVNKNSLVILEHAYNTIMTTWQPLSRADDLFEAREQVLETLLLCRGPLDSISTIVQEHNRRNRAITCDNRRVSIISPSPPTSRVSSSSSTRDERRSVGNAIGPETAERESAEYGRILERGGVHAALADRHAEGVSHGRVLGSNELSAATRGAATTTHERRERRAAESRLAEAAAPTAATAAGGGRAEVATSLFEAEGHDGHLSFRAHRGDTGIDTQDRGEQLPGGGAGASTRERGSSVLHEGRAPVLSSIDSDTSSPARGLEEGLDVGETNVYHTLVEKEERRKVLQRRRELREKCNRRLCEICVEGLQR